MKFRTTIPIVKLPVKINHQNKIFLIGSCFTENIVNKLQYHQFKTFCNPNGILYNPLSIFKSIESIVDNKKIIKEDLQFKSDHYYHFDFHSSYADRDWEVLLQRIKIEREKANLFLSQANIIFISLGTAWYYERNGEIVASCHKHPASEFDKKIADPDTIKKAFDIFRSKLFKINPNLKVVFTISPVRHLKDGFIENHRSKALLINSVHELCEQFLNTYYFPSYEIMMDDLRDYRFYKHDLLHPNDLAINYIWNYFEKVFFSDETIILNKQIDKFKKSLKHKPLRLGKEYNSFREELSKKINIFNKQNSNIEPIKIPNNDF